MQKVERRTRTSDAALVQVPKLAFVLNDHYERLLKLRDERPAVFEELATREGVALIHYEAAKLDFDREGQAAG